jgi:glycogen debranching enzyme
VVLQPALHDLVGCVRAPTSVFASAGGDIRPVGAQGAFRGDVRVLSRAELTVSGERPLPVASWLDGPAGAVFASVLRHLGHPVHDPTVRVERRREALVDGVRELVRISSTSTEAVTAEVTVDLEVDLARIHAVKNGDPVPAPLTPVVDGESVTWTGAVDGSPVTIVARAPGARVRATQDATSAAWSLPIAARGSAQVSWVLTVSDPGAVVQSPSAATVLGDLDIACDDRRMAPYVRRSLADLDALRLECVDQPGVEFLAAGAPWYLTLFGRDSLWAARMSLPLGTRLAGDTLEVLAARQGTRYDVDSAQAPGKILHELRRASTGHAAFGSMQLPPVYYGTVDATALWVLLLHDAWCWGLAPERVERLLPALERAMGWITTDADADGDGFLEYLDASGHGLANQGWKDSADSVRFRDGRLATGAVALAEVQGYAHEAALAAGRLFTAFGRPDPDRWASWAGDLSGRFRSSFWVEDGRGAYPAMALDGDKTPVDSVTSNIGHLLGTGLLRPDEAALVAGRLASPDMDSGFGLRTMSTESGGYSALSYHCGSVWAHDTAVVALGLSREGFAVEAASLTAGLLSAASTMQFRLPELYAGDAASSAPMPVPYPASCRPQAWAAAAGVTAVQVLLGLRMPASGQLVVAPPRPMPVGALRVSGLKIGDGELSVSVDRDGTVLDVQAVGVQLEVAVE